MTHLMAVLRSASHLTYGHASGAGSPDPPLAFIIPPVSPPRTGVSVSRRDGEVDQLSRLPFPRPLRNQPVMFQLLLSKGEILLARSPAEPPEHVPGHRRAVGAAEGEATGKLCLWCEQASCFSQPLTVTGRSQRSRRNREPMSPDRLRRYQG
jgi:hypothetical protein